MILHNATVDTILERRSVRSYAPQQITPDELETILEAGRSAPSGMNQQSAIAVAVQSKAELAQLVELAKAAAHQDHNPFYDAPTVILVFAKMTNLAPMEDGCTAIENMLLAAKSLGIGTCWIYAVNALFASDAGVAWQDAHGIGNIRKSLTRAKFPSTRQGIPPEQNLSQRNTMHFINAFNENGGTDQ